MTSITKESVLSLAGAELTVEALASFLAWCMPLASETIFTLYPHRDHPAGQDRKFHQIVSIRIATPFGDMVVAEAPTDILKVDVVIAPAGSTALRSCAELITAGQLLELAKAEIRKPLHVKRDTNVLMCRPLADRDGVPCKLVLASCRPSIDIF